MKEMNTDLVRRTLRARREAAAPELAELTGLSTVTVGAVLTALVAAGEVGEAELAPSGGGRPARRFRYNGEYRHALLLSLCTEEGEVAALAETVNLYGEQAARRMMVLREVRAESFGPLIDACLREDSAVGALGFGLPGLEEAGKIRLNDFEGLAGARFTEHYRERYGLPTAVENDVNLAVLGYCRGAGLESPAAYLYFPDNAPPGAGFYLNGEVYRGKNAFAGEIRFLPIGIHWETLDQGQFRPFCDAVAKLVTTLCCVLNPEAVILAGPRLTEAHVAAADIACKQAVGERFAPRLLLSPAFHRDFSAGLSAHTRALLERAPAIGGHL